MQQTIAVADDTYSRLARQAAAAGTTVEAIAGLVLEQFAQESTTAKVDLPEDAWKQVFDQLISDAHSRADRYPAGFECDVSREAIYEGRAE